MKEREGEGAWREVLNFPLAGRVNKPRRTGLTMVIDKGAGLTEVKELLELGSDYIDYLKLGFGTSALYSARLLHQKIALVRSYGVSIFPGGTFLEIAVLQGKLKEYLEISRRLGYTHIEVSDGTIEMDPLTRRQVIRAAQEEGFRVISEVGKKDRRDQISTGQIVWQVETDLDNGVEKVIVEGRESGEGVVIFDQKGALKEKDLNELVNGISRPEEIIWEAPFKHQQHSLITIFGPNVNLGNVQPGDVLALESLRLGLRGDTLRAVLKAMSGEGPGEERPQSFREIGI